jgi:hypothetical protein
MIYNPCNLQGESLEVSLARLLWTQKHDFGPSARSGHAMAFAPDRACVVLFGGLAPVSGSPTTVPVGDTWEWGWRKLDADGRHGTERALVTGGGL